MAFGIVDNQISLSIYLKLLLIFYFLPIHIMKREASLKGFGLGDSKMKSTSLSPAMSFGRKIW
jgi:hypothetical protein